MPTYADEEVTRGRLHDADHAVDTMARRQNDVAGDFIVRACDSGGWCNSRERELFPEELIACRAYGAAVVPEEARNGSRGDCRRRAALLDDDASEERAVGGVSRENDLGAGGAAQVQRGVGSRSKQGWERSRGGCNGGVGNRANA